MINGPAKLAKRLLPDIVYRRAKAAKERATLPLPSRRAIQKLSNVERARALTRSVWTITSGAVRGDVAEFGTMSGFTATVLARALSVTENILPEPRILHLFDSFEGLPDASSPIDQAQPFVQDGIWGRGKLRGLSEGDLRDRCGGEYRPEKIRTYAGWFADTVPRLPENTRFALLHVDGDLYQSCIDALEPCFRNGWISEGAIIHFDDWNSGRASDELGERRAWRELVQRHEIRFTFGGFYAEAGSWFIIHSYRGCPR